MIKYAYVIIAATVLLGACSKKERETPNGFKYLVMEEGDGVLPKTQEVVIFNYILKDSKDSVWGDTRKMGIPAVVPIADSAMIPMEKGIHQVFRYLSKGDSIKASMDIRKFFEDIGGGPVPPGFDTTLTLTYFIRVTNVLSREQFGEFQTNLMKDLQGKQKVKDADAIAKYLADHSIQAQQDSSGISYVIHTSKGGKKPTVANCVEVSYKGTFLEGGETFDQNPKMAFPLGQVIPGWQNAIPLIGVGDSATFYIPSGLAYGPQGQPGAIPPNAIMIFDVKLLAVGDNMDPNTRMCK